MVTSKKEKGCHVKIRKSKDTQWPHVLFILNEVALDLQNKGIYQWSYPWEEETVKNEIDDCFVLLLGEKIVGTFFITTVDRLNELPIIAESMYLSKIAVLPEYQGRNLGANIITYACSYAKRREKALYLDCWAGNEKLKAFYSTNGFTYLGDYPEEDYYVSVFRV